METMKTAEFTSIVVLNCTLVIGVVGASSEPSVLGSEQTKYFETHIRPALVQYCYDCHSEETGKTRGGLLLDTREGMLRGGDNGNVLAGGSYEESLFWEAITWRDLEMPPKDKMPAAVIAKFEAWLKMGAPDPRVRATMVVESSVDLEAGRKHWAFQPPVFAPGATIDSLIEAGLAAALIAPVEAADAGTLLRRIHFDLIGLPPTPDEVDRFVSAWNRDSDAAVTAKVDELLGREQYGERWGRHWLDVARYGESTGKDVNMTYPHIWRYRDYVFDSFNADKPYDEFIREQIAGDLLKVKSEAEWQENLIATGFLAMGTKGLNEANPRQHRMEVADEQIDAMSQAVLGLTISCARCHDHKYDPIPTTDYYALAGIFLSTDTFYGTVTVAQNKRATELIRLPLPDPMLAENRFSAAEMERMESQRQQLRQTAREARGNEKSSQQMMLNLRRRISELDTELAQIGADGVPTTLALGVQDARQTSDAEILVRGDVEKPAQSVARGFPQVLPGGGPAQIRTGESGRRELAEWLTSKDNPLTARVMVNRVWLKLFGEGLVSSPNNWGLTGQRPTHPELLDLLAVQFVSAGWSVKDLIRKIVLSDAYQRASRLDAASYAIDPDNKLLWRANPRPLDAEALRDSVLAIGGGIDFERPYGSQVAKAGDGRVGQGISQDTVASGVRYRSVYLPILRDDLPDALGLFDFADPNVSKPKREATNVPAQALFLMNNRLIITEAASMAKELIKRFPDVESRIRYAFLRAYGRQADEADMAAANAFLSHYRPVRQFDTEHGASRRPQGPFRRSGGMGGGRSRPGARTSEAEIPRMTSEEQTLAVFCQGLMASAEFRLLN
jgi:hypothetical protein